MRMTKGACRNHCRRPRIPLFRRQSVLGLEAQAFETVVELSELAATVEQAVHAGPSRMRLRINVEFHDVAFFAPGGASREGRTVGHFNGDLVIVRVNVLFHH